MLDDNTHQLQPQWSEIMGVARWARLRQNSFMGQMGKPRRSKQVGRAEVSPPLSVENVNIGTFFYLFHTLGVKLMGSRFRTDVRK